MTKKFKFATKPLEYGQEFYYFSPNDENFYAKDCWTNYSFDFQRLKLHRVFLTEEDAKRASEFVQEYIRSNPEKLNYITNIPDQDAKVWFGLGMWGTENDPDPIVFDINNEFHKKLFDNSRLYKTSEDVTNASNLVNLALETEYKRQKYKFLTEPPAQGTTVFYPDFDNCDLKSGVAYIHYDSNKIWHVVLFRRGVLFLKEKHAIQASKKMLRRINPSACKLTFKSTK